MKTISDKQLNILMNAARGSIKGSAKHHITHVNNPSMGLYKREYEICDVIATIIDSGKGE